MLYLQVPTRVLYTDRDIYAHRVVGEHFQIFWTSPNIRSTEYFQLEQKTHESSVAKIIFNCLDLQSDNGLS